MTGWERGGWDQPPRYYYNPAAYPFRPSREQEVESLKAQAGYFEDALQNIQRRIQDLEGSSQSENA